MRDDDPIEDAINDEGDDSHVPFLPTADKIAEGCRIAQLDWSDDERERRWTGPRRVAWLPPGATRSGERCEQSAVGDLLAW